MLAGSRQTNPPVRLMLDENKEIRKETSSRKWVEPPPAAVKVHREIGPYSVYVQASSGAPQPVSHESKCPSWLLQRE